MTLSPSSSIYVAGHRGMVGSALMRRLKSGGYANVLTRSSVELNLLEQTAVRSFFQRERPDYVLMAAAKVGGIEANDNFRAQFLYQNLMMEANVIHEAYAAGVKGLLFLGSSCIYPRDCPQPIREEYLLSGPLEQTNEPYAIAKIAGLKLCESYNRQYGTQYLAVMPCNLYGPNDNFDPHSSHVLPALLRKAHEIRLIGGHQLAVWGSGLPRREFMHVDDLADACVFLMELAHSAQASSTVPQLLNVGSGTDVTIRELAQLIMTVVGLEAQLVFDGSKPDGTPRKLLDVSRLATLGWRPRISLQQGIGQVYAELCEFSDVA